MIVLPIILFVIYGIMNSISDTLLFHYTTSRLYEPTKDKTFWNPVESYKNKYKDGDKEKGPKFFGSTTFLVVITDALHLIRALQVLVLLIATYTSSSFFIAITGLTLAKIVFEICFRWLDYDIFPIKPTH